MTYHATSRPKEIKDFTAFGVPSLADVILAVQAAGALTPRQREDMVSAVRTVSRVIGLPAADIPAAPAFLQPRLADVAVVAHGFGKEHWSNTRSRFAAALKIAGVPLVPGKRRTPLSPIWAEFQARMPNKWLRSGTSRLAGYCSALGIPPEEVTDQVMARFARDLEQASLVRSPRSVINRARHSWNEAVTAAIPDGPKSLLSRPTRGDRYSLAWSEFAPSFVQDLESWLERLRGDDLLADLPFKPLRAISIGGRRAQVRQIASGWVRRGNDPESLRSLADLIRPEVAREALRFHLERRPDRKPTLGIFHYTWALRAIARHWVQADKATLAALRILAARCKPEGDGITAKNMRVLRALDDTEVRDRLLGLPRRLVRGLRQGVALTRAQALRVQTALMIEILIVAPIRLRNLAALDLDRHLERPGGSQEAMLLRFAPHEVKNATGLHHELRATTQKLLDLYLTSARPVLCGVPSTLLFPGRAGRLKAHSAIANQISKTVFQKIGIRMTPHQFRHAVGKIILDQMPGALSLVSDLLGHKSTETARKFYGGLDQVRAAKSYDKLLTRLRGEDSDEGEK